MRRNNWCPLCPQ